MLNFSLCQYVFTLLAISASVEAGFWSSSLPSLHLDLSRREPSPAISSSGRKSQPLHRRKLNLARGTWTRADGCTKYVNIRSRDTCSSVAKTAGLASWTQLRLWNSGLDATCSNLFLGQTYCVAGPASSSPPKSTVQVPSPSTTTTIATTAPQTTTAQTVVATSTRTTSIIPAATSTSPVVNGQATYYYTGLGACGWVNKDTDYIVAMSYQVWESYPGNTANPNLSPICNQKIQLQHTGDDGKVNTVIATVVDMCPSPYCDYGHVDLSPAAFKALAPLSKGLINVKWQFI